MDASGPQTWAIRDATPDDAVACLDIYTPYVIQTAITFEIEPPTVAEMQRRIAASVSTHAWLVAELGSPTASLIVGYTYARPLGERPAYRWSCETSIYIRQDHRQAGLGRALYARLITRLADRGYRQALACMSIPNSPSETFHRAMGYEPVGVHRNVGWKLGAWHDIAWMQRTISEGGDPPTEPF